MTTDFHPILSYPDLSTEELAQKYKVTPQYVREIRRGTVYKRFEGDSDYDKYKWVHWVSDRLSAMGIEHKVLPDFQISIHNKIAWVGIGSLMKSPSQAGLPYVNFRRGRGFNQSDWIIGIIRDTETVYVIPTKIIPKTDSPFRIQEIYADFGRPSKYEMYCEAWYLLTE